MTTLAAFQSSPATYTPYARSLPVATVAPTMAYRQVAYATDNIDLKPTPVPDMPATTPQTAWYNKPGVRVAGMMAGGAAISGTAGYFIGRSMGAAGMGTAIGVGVGAIAPIAMVAFALWQWGRKH